MYVLQNRLCGLTSYIPTQVVSFQHFPRDNAQNISNMWIPSYAVVMTN